MEYHFKNMQQKASNWMPWTKAEAELAKKDHLVPQIRRIQATCENTHVNKCIMACALINIQNV